MFEFRLRENCLDARVSVSSFESSNVPAFKEALAEHVPETVDAATVDLSAVEMIDSSAIGALLSVQKRLAGNGNQVVLKGVRPTVVSVIELLRLHRVFRIELEEEVSLSS